MFLWVSALCGTIASCAVIIAFLAILLVYIKNVFLRPIFNKIYDYQNFPQLRPLNCETDTFEPQNYNRYMDKWNTRWSF